MTGAFILFSYIKIVGSRGAEEIKSKYKYVLT